MALTRQDKFRFGFLQRCAEEGCTVDEIRARVKRAELLLSTVPSREKSAGGIVDTLKSLLSQGLWWPVTAGALGVGGATVLGAGTGYGLAKMQDQQVDPEEAKRQELLSAYRAQTDRINRKLKMMNYRQAQPSMPKLFDDQGASHGI